MVHVRQLDAAVAADAEFVDQLTELINDVYAIAETGIWRDGVTRTKPPELAELIRAGEIAVATRDGELVGSVPNSEAPGSDALSSTSQSSAAGRAA